MEHDHSHKVQGSRLVLTIVLNLLITIAQLIGGLISGSLSLLSDALHNFSDVVALIISYIANRLILRKQTKGQTFGYRRAEIIAALINAITLIIIALILIKEATSRLLLSDYAEIKSEWIIWLALFSILMNALCVLILQKDAKENLNIRSAYIHLFSDMMTSVAVFLGGLAIYYFKIFWI
ncbi:MAG: cobalt-zinc-cadmium efflux system protein, partial [bacterium]